MMKTSLRQLLTLAILTLLLVGAMTSQSVPAATANSAAPEACDRACLNRFVDQFLDAVVAHDPSRLPVANTVKFTENGQRLALGDGFWNTASDRGKYKLYVDDPETGEVGFFGTMKEAGTPVILALRLKVENRQVSEIETLLARQQKGAESLEKLGSPHRLFQEAIAPEKRVSREELIKTANMYFSGMQLNDGKGVYPFSADCNRIENGMQTTNNPNLVTPVNDPALPPPKPDPDAKPTMYSAAWSCQQQFESGLLHFVTRIRDRRYPIVDVERGLVFSLVFFDHAAGKTRTFQVPDGRTVTAGPTTPWTWEIAELFKVDNGKLRQIEAVLERCPYGMGSGWSSWQDAMSDKARW